MRWRGCRRCTGTPQQPGLRGVHGVGGGAAAGIGTRAARWWGPPAAARRWTTELRVPVRRQLQQTIRKSSRGGWTKDEVGWGVQGRRHLRF